MAVAEQGTNFQILKFQIPSNNVGVSVTGNGLAFYSTVSTKKPASLFSYTLFRIFWSLVTRVQRLSTSLPTVICLYDTVLGTVPTLTVQAGIVIQHKTREGKLQGEAKGIGRKVRVQYHLVPDCALPPSCYSTSNVYCPSFSRRACSVLFCFVLFRRVCLVKKSHFHSRQRTAVYCIPFLTFF